MSKYKKGDRLEIVNTDMDLDGQQGTFLHDDEEDAIVWARWDDDGQVDGMAEDNVKLVKPRDWDTKSNG